MVKPVWNKVECACADPVVGQRRRMPSGYVYKINGITNIESLMTGCQELFVSVEYEDKVLNQGHPFKRLWPVTMIVNDVPLEVALENRSRVTAGPPWMGAGR